VGSRRRLGAELIRRDLADDDDEARSLIGADRVLVNGAVAANPARLVAASDAVIVVTLPRFVSRGGDKLDHALDVFAVEVAGRRWLDAGASTGGFTDCLLQRRAAGVVALDVGHGHLHPKLRDDDRVTVIERRHVRDAKPADLGGLASGVVADLSFISLTSVIGPLVRLCQPGSPMVLLVKPQFEARRSEVNAGRGVISDPDVRQRVRSEIEASLVGHGCAVLAWSDSPITGAEGNVELFVHATTPATGVRP
jgi:23S rRNA (cytidine1920-2'-O)/16S rRNA (cytidine1409-2'-O)-methyltransferase